MRYDDDYRPRRRSHEDYEEDDRPRQRRRTSPDRVACSVLWALCILGVVLVLMGHVSAFGRGPTAVQQAACGADTACWLIGGYVLVRAITSILAGQDGQG